MVWFRLFLCVFTCCTIWEVTSASVVENPGLTTKCEFYNKTLCSGNSSHPQCNEPEECGPPGEGKRSHCFVVWVPGENGAQTIILKGCFLNNEDCYDKSECVEKAMEPNNKHLWCCCEGNMCNRNFSWVPTPTEAPPSSTAVPTPTAHYLTLGETFLICFVILITIVFAFAGWVLYRKRKVFQERFFKVPTSEPLSRAPPSPFMDTRPIKLIEIIARGRFGAVWKAQFKSEEVAVKIFPVQDKQSWVTEQQIFQLAYMDHPNILHYIGVEKRGENLQQEFWLITSYHEKGSLCDYLKSYTLTWKELCIIASTMARGLMHLHEAIPGKVPNDPLKPAIAHRDFKSKNVLLKSDMTACIADFGLAIVFETCGDTHGQVGTRRYMAPEVLEGAINFTSDAFLRIDMYACGLVLWELVSRCLSATQGGPVPEYRLPFEEEVGRHPTLEDMQESVVQRKVRPTIPEHWRHHPDLSSMVDTMEECWDHDAEARLSASCVMERVLLSLQKPSLGLIIENEAPLNPFKDNNL